MPVKKSNTLQRKSKRGQMNQLAVIALSFVILITLYYMFSRTSTENKIKIDQVHAEFVSRQLQKLRQDINNELNRIIYESVSDMALHGGYTSSNVPSLHYLHTPYWYYKGNVVNIPSIEIMEQMLSRDIEFRVDNYVTELKANYDNTIFYIGHTEVKSKILDSSIEVVMVLPIDTEYNDKKASADIEFNQNVLLRLKFLRDLAHNYVNKYNEETGRGIERALRENMQQDPRTQSKIHHFLGKKMPCNAKKIYKRKADQVYAFREAAQYASAMELRNIRQSDFQKKYEKIEWTYELNENSVEFDFLANEGKEDYESEEVIYYFPKPLGLPMVKADGECHGTIDVKYNVNFPVKIIIRDLLESARVVGVTGSAQIKPLEFVFVVHSFLEDVNIHTKEESKIPSLVDDLCTGSCNVEFTIKNSKEGRLELDACGWEYQAKGEDGYLKKENVICKMHDLVVKANEKNRAIFAEKVNIGENFKKTVYIQSYGTVMGKVLKKDVILCITSQTTKLGDNMPLSYLKGIPPRGIEVLFKPLDLKLGEVRRTLVDEDSRFEIKLMNPGRYLVLFVPLMDEIDFPSYKVESLGMIYEIKEGNNDLGTILMDPLLIEKVGNEFVHVSRREDC